MELSELSSQESSVRLRSIFVDANGGPCKINVQAVELDGRPKLVRTLKNAGASVVSNVKDATIILVDSSTECGRRLVRMWGKDPSKVVLDCAWAGRSLQAGRALLQADGWGGVQAIDDGLPVRIDGISVDDDEQEVAALVPKSPLPTPRITPDDPSIRKHEEYGPAAIVSALSMQPSPASAAAAASTSTAAMVAPASSGAPDTNQWQFSQSLSTPQSVPSTSDLSSQQQPQVSHNPLPSNAFNTSITPSFLPSQLPVAPMPPLIATQQMDNSAMYSMMMTMWDVVRHSGAAGNQITWPSSDTCIPTQPQVNTPGSISNGSHTVPHFYSTFQTIPQHPEVNPIPHIQNGMTGLQANGRPSKEMIDSRPRLSEPTHRPPSSQQSPTEALTPSMSRKKSTQSKSTPSHRKREIKGKGKTSPPSDLAENDGHPDALLPFFGSMSPAPSSSPPEPSRVVITPRNVGEIFLSEGGEPSRFFVQVDLHGRHNVVSNIKKNKGKIVNNIADADYVIATTRSKAYDWILKEATVLEKIPIQAAFVADCVEEGALLNEVNYALEGPLNARHTKHARQRAAFEKRVGMANERPRASILSSEVSRSEMARSNSPTTITTRGEPSTPVEPSLASGSPKLASPSPPPPETRQLMVDGKYYFTEAEDLYFCEHAKYHLGRDPSMAMTTLVQKLHKKMPHHSVISWQGHIDRKLRGKLDDIRKRANILKRKNVTDGRSSGQMSEPALSKKRRLSPSPSYGPSAGQRRLNPSPSYGPNAGQPPESHSTEDLEREDFDTICQFFASGKGDDDNDELVWQKLADHRRCKTANSWPEYYQAHQEEVYRHIEELMSERAQAETV